MENHRFLSVPRKGYPCHGLFLENHGVPKWLQNNGKSQGSKMVPKMLENRRVPKWFKNSHTPAQSIFEIFDWKTFLLMIFWSSSNGFRFSIGRTFFQWSPTYLPIEFCDILSTSYRHSIDISSTSYRHSIPSSMINISSTVYRKIIDLRIEKSQSHPPHHTHILRKSIT